MFASLDRSLTLFLNGSDSLYVDHLAWLATSTLTWLPVGVVLLYVIIRNNDMRNILSIVLFLGIALLLADQVASGICKPYFARPRPARELELMQAVDIVNGYRGGKYGFFSSHAANTMAIATFLARLIRNRALNVSLFFWVFLNCWTRIYLGVHYVGDITVGLVWGALVGIGLYSVWGRYVCCGEKRCIPGRPDNQTPTGYQLADVELLRKALLLSYLFVAVGAFF